MISLDTPVTATKLHYQQSALTDPNSTNDTPPEKSLNHVNILIFIGLKLLTKTMVTKGTGFRNTYFSHLRYPLHSVVRYLSPEKGVDSSGRFTCLSTSFSGAHRISNFPMREED